MEADLETTEPEGFGNMTAFAWTQRGRIRDGARVRTEIDGRRVTACLSPKRFKLLRRKLLGQGLVSAKATPSECLVARVVGVLKDAVKEGGQTA